MSDEDDHPPETPVRAFWMREKVIAWFSATLGLLVFPLWAALGPSLVQATNSRSPSSDTLLGLAVGGALGWFVILTLLNLLTLVWALVRAHWSS